MNILPPLADNNKPTSQDNPTPTVSKDTPQGLGCAPYSLEAEASVLGAGLTSKDALEKTAILVAPDDFYYQRNRFVYDAMFAVFLSGGAVDIVTVLDELRRRGQDAEVGGWKYLDSLVAMCPAADSVESYARQVRHHSTTRQFRGELQAVANLETHEALPALQALIAKTEMRAVPMPARFILRNLAELANRPPRVYLIDGFLYLDGTSLLTAKEGSFKSFFGLDMGLCACKGIPWHGHNVKHGPVVYVVAEGAAGIIKRVRAWCIEHNCELPSDFHIIDEPVQISNPAVLAAIGNDVAAVSPVLIILDTLARCAVGMDDSSSKDMGLFMEAARQLSERSGAHVMTIHHNNKSGDYRGSTALVAAVDSWLSLERPEYGDYVTLSFPKIKDDEAPSPMVFEKVSIPLDEYNLGSSLIFRSKSQNVSRDHHLSAVENTVLSELAETHSSAGATVAEWQRSCLAVGVIERTFKRTKNHLEKLKMVHCDDPGKRGARWTLTETGQNMAAALRGEE